MMAIIFQKLIFYKAIMTELLTDCRDILLKLEEKHLTPKSQGRIWHVFNHYSDQDLLTNLYTPWLSGPHLCMHP
uniref:Uncharacterized protein n=1 Tax=Hucho hucho TaxID=62062 RepID=A0A4W5LGV8_9TELE